MPHKCSRVLGVCVDPRHADPEDLVVDWAGSHLCGLRKFEVVQLLLFSLVSLFEVGRKYFRRRICKGKASAFGGTCALRFWWNVCTSDPVSWICDPCERSSESCCRVRGCASVAGRLESRLLDASAELHSHRTAFAAELHRDVQCVKPNCIRAELLARCVKRRVTLNLSKVRTLTAICAALLEVTDRAPIRVV